MVQRSPLNLERVPENLETPAVRLRHQRDHIEPRLAIQHVMDRQVLQGRSRDALLLTSGYRLCRCAVGCAPPGLHLNEDNRRSFLGHNIDLPVPATIVLRKNAIAGPAKRRPGSLLAEEARLPASAGHGSLRGGMRPRSEGVYSEECQGRTPLKVRRCAGQGPYCARAARCSAVG